jgi:hypothetical protein
VLILKVILIELLILVLYLLWQKTKPIDGIDRTLLEAANGDKELARYLLIQARVKFPHKSEKWYLRKAMSDLNRPYGEMQNRKNRRPSTQEVN